MKKSRDSRDIFAVFKPGSFMEGATTGEKLRYWFKNVYWYHFKIATFAAIFLIICVCTFISDVFFREYNDLDYILAGALFADSQTLDALTEKIGSFVVTDDNEPPEIGRQMLCTQSVMGTGDQALAIDEYVSASIEKIAISMADDEILLFFLDKRYIDWYAEQGAFEPLSNLGIESENEYFVRVDTTAFFDSFNISHETGIYAGIKVKNKARLKNERIVQKYENATRVLAGILAGG